MSSDAIDFDAVARALARMETELKVPSGFLTRLLTEDDWSFVIKTHALVEATVTHLLTESIDARLRSVFERLPLSNRMTGKTACAEAVELIDPNERRFIQTMSELRNRLVHDVTQVSFRFENYLANVEKGQRSAFAETITWALKTDDTEGTSEKFALEAPKMAIWSSTIALLAKVIGRTTQLRSQKALSALRRRRLEEFTATINDPPDLSSENDGGLK